MDKKGFTLIELLAVIAILAIVLLIAVPYVISLVNGSSFAAYKTQHKNMKHAAELYLSSNVSLYPNTIDGSVFIKLSDLIANGYMSDIIDTKDKSTCSAVNSGVYVKKTSASTYDYQTYLNCGYYKSDTTAPYIKTSISGANLTVTATDADSISLNGTSDYGLITATFPATLTIEAWAYTSSIEAKMLWSFDGTNHPSGPDLYPACNKLNLNIGDGCSNPFLNQTAFPTNNIWHHYAIVFDQIGDVGTLYVDGVLIGTAAYRNPAGPLLYISRFDAGNYFWNGQIREFRVWNTIRTGTEILSNMNSTLIGNETGLMAYYRMNETEGNIAYDSTSNKYNAIFNSDTWHRNSGVKEIRIKQGVTLINSSTQSKYTFNLAPGTYTVEVEDNAGLISTAAVTIV